MARKSYDELTIKDDFLFCKVMSDPELCKEMIEILLDIEVDRIEYIQRQYPIDADYQRHSIRLDVYVKGNDKIFDIEMQTTDKANLEKRARYYQGLIDIDHLEHEMDYKTLKESYIIFLCTFDPFDSGLVKYSVSQVLNGDLCLGYNDNTHKVFYNLYGKADENFNEISTQKLRDFLSYLRTNVPTNDFTHKVEQAALEAKYNTSWRKEYMTVGLWIEEAKEEARKEGRAEGEKQKSIEVAVNFFKSGIDVQTISKCVGLPLEEIKEITKDL